MTSTELDRLVDSRGLKREPPSKAEFDGLVRSGVARLADAGNASLSLESRFDLACNAAHALALAALRRMGYRCANRYLVFQTLPHTTGVPASVWRALSTRTECMHEVRVTRNATCLSMRALSTSARDCLTTCYWLRRPFATPFQP